MLLENFLSEMQLPLNAIYLLSNDIDYKIDEDWEFFRSNKREEAKELKAYITALQCIISSLLNLSTEYKTKMEKEYY